MPIIGQRPRATTALLLALALVAGLLGLVPPAAAQVVDRIDAYGAAADAGSPAATGTNRAVGVAAHAGGGYWTTTARGEVNSFAGAPFHGSLGGTALARPIVAMAATPAGDGYWLVASDGGVFAFGAARFLGSTGAIRLNQPIVAMAVAPGATGYWLIARDGGVFSFGSARFHGSTGGTRLNQPIVAAAADPETGGYWLAAADGGVFAFGGAPFEGSAGAVRLASPITAMAAEPGGGGYWLAAADGGVFTYGGAPFHGSSGGRTSAERVTAMATTAAGTGYWLLRSPAPPPPPRPAAPGVAVPAGSGAGRRIVYSNTAQRVWLVGADGVVESTYAVSGRRDVPPAGTYSVFSKSRLAYAGHDDITMRNMVRFTRGKTLAIGFHSIPRDAAGRPLQTESDLGGYRSAGCVRQADADSERLWDFAPLGTKVVVVY